MRERWSWIGITSAIATLVLLFAEHFLDHGRDLNPVDHWMSEYVLSGSPLAVWIMRLAFVALALSALSIAMVSRTRTIKALFLLSAAGLAAMTLLDTYPNDGVQRPKWPLTPGNAHQLLLYLAIGATLVGMAVHARRSQWPRIDRVLLLLAVCATAVQTYLVAVSQAHGQMTHFGGVTERVIVAATLVWVAKTTIRARFRPASSAGP